MGSIAMGIITLFIAFVGAIAFVLALKFHQVLRQNWKLEQELDLPSWGRIKDAVRIYKRRIVSA